MSCCHVHLLKIKSVALSHNHLFYSNVLVNSGKLKKSKVNIFKASLGAGNSKTNYEVGFIKNIYSNPKEKRKSSNLLSPSGV